MMSIQKFGDADVVFTDNASNAGQRQLQFVGRGRHWEKDAGLHCAWMHRFE